MTRVAILRCGKLPSFVTWEIPNLDELFEEDNLLIRGFEEQGFQAESVIWNDPAIDWNQFDIALIRSTWDYLDEQGQFLQVLAQIEASSCRLFNPLEAVRWNINKNYLFDLERWDVRIVPTYSARNLNIDSLVLSLAHQQVATVILKPTVGLGGSNSHQVPLEELADKLNVLRATDPDREYLIQPFMDSVLNEGEWSFVYFSNQLSHVLLKKPAPNEYRVQSIYGGSIQPAEPSPDDLRQAESVRMKLPFDVLYARLDLMRVDGRLAIMEVELIEPIFSFNLVPESIQRLVHATKFKFKASEK